MQDYALLVLSSVTYAKRVEQILEQRGITSAIGHTPKHIAKKGCSYTLKLKMRDLPEALKITDALMLKVQGIYRKKGDGDYDLLG